MCIRKLKNDYLNQRGKSSVNGQIVNILDFPDTETKSRILYRYSENKRENSCLAVPSLHPVAVNWRHSLHDQPAAVNRTCRLGSGETIVSLTLP